jgi:hypothetical protein
MSFPNPPTRDPVRLRWPERALLRAIRLLIGQDGDWRLSRHTALPWLNPMHYERGERLMSTWTKIDRAGAAYILLNVVFWWAPLLLLVPGVQAVQIAIVLGLVRDAALGVVFLGYRMMRPHRSLT